MTRLTRKISSRILVVTTILAASLVAVGIAGTRGLQQTADLADSIYADHLATTGATVDVGRALDDVYRASAVLAVASDGAAGSRLIARLYELTPALEVAIDRLLTAHEDDPPAELATLRQFRTDWAGVKADVVAGLTVPGAAHVPTEGDVTAAFDPLVDEVHRLIDRERSDADQARSDARDEYEASRTTIVLITALALAIGALMLLFLLRRVIPKALSLEEDQADFGEAITLAQDEEDAHDFLRRHLDRVIAGSSTVVLRRNNSANRLELTDRTDDGPLRLEDAEPRSCVAVRTARPHLQQDGRDLLLSCRVCGDCVGTTLCNPLTVGGEVIGAVLVNALHPLDGEDERRVRETVAQAAPVLANLRNLAVAEFRAATDSLTGLPNRRGLTDTLRRMVAQAARSGSPLSLLSLDLDHFKRINDQFGHAVGDQVLAAVGAALQTALRDSDFAGRHGGEEFLVLLPDTGLTSALEVADKIHHTIGEILIAAVGRRVTVSIGVAVYPDHAKDVESLERGADRALYDAKNNGRNRTAVCALAGPANFASPVLDLADPVLRERHQPTVGG